MSPIEYARRHEKRFAEELRQFVRIPSVSSDPTRKANVRQCADWLARHLKRIGVPEVRIVQPGGPPAVVGRIGVDRDRPTLLLYGHFDVVPEGSHATWRHPPYGAEIADGYLHGRGAADDKGQMLAHVKAIESWLKTRGKPPCNLLLLFEGGEEIGSPGLDTFLRKHRKAFEADGAVVSDTMMLGPGRPVLTTGLRGGLSVELFVEGPPADLHSGSFGGLVRNPLQALCEIVASMHDRTGRVAIEGFYRGVSSARIRVPVPAAQELMKAAGVNAVTGEQPYSAYERVAIRPALTINGLTGGHQGPGGKSIIPARASAKLGFRLVPGQTPDEVEELLRAHVERVCPKGIRWRLQRHSGSQPVTLDPRAKVMQAARRACVETFGREPAFLPSGGSIPIVNTFQSVLGTTTALMGFALRTDNLHGPNERFALKRFNQATQASIRLMEAFATP